MARRAGRGSMNEAELKALAGRYGFARVALCAPEPFERWGRARAGAHRTAQHLSANPLEIAPVSYTHLDRAGEPVPDGQAARKAA